MFKTILVPMDNSETTNGGLDEAIRIAKASGGRLRLFHAVDDVAFAVALQACDPCVIDWRSIFEAEGRALLESAVATARAAGVEADSALSVDYTRTIAERVADEVRQCGADLIVIGTHGRRGVARAFIGSVAEDILRQSSIPVLLVRTEAAAKTAPASPGFPTTVSTAETAAA